MIRPFTSYLRTVGLYQTWNLFAPNPTTTAVSVEAKGTFANGSSFHWAFPQRPSADLVSEILWERSRKFQERIRQDKNRFMWDDFAFRLSGRIGSPDNPVQEVMLIRRWSDVQRPFGHDAPAPEKEFVFLRKRLDHES